MTAHRVNLVNEDDAWRILLALFEKVTHARGADADEHFDEVRTRNREERHVGFARDGARQQRLTRAWRPHHQNAFRNAPAELLEFLRLFEEFDDLLKFFLRFL